MQRKTLVYLLMILALLAALLPISAAAQGDGPVAQDTVANPAQPTARDLKLAQEGPAAPPAAFNPAAILYDNGPLTTHPGGGAGGANASALQTSLGLTTFGFGHQLLNNNRVADDFTVPAGGWNISTITFYAYQTGSTTTSTINNVNLRIWNGVPGAGGSSVVFGDTTTNRLAGSSFSNIYRVEDIALTANNRPIMANVVTVNTNLPAGTYWLDWQTGGTLSSGPWAPPVSILNQTGKPGANGQQSLAGAAFVPALDGTFPQDFPFVIEGATASGPSISLQKTVGTTAGVCAGTSAISVPEGATVYYCYTVTNTGDTTLNLHNLNDDILGTIFSGLNYALTPGSSVNTVAAGLSIPYVANATTTNVATWTAYNTGGAQVTANATATVTVIPNRCPAGSNEVTLLTQDFSGSFPPAGWVVANSTTGCVAPGVPDWTNTDPGLRTNLTGGSGLFAIADSDACGSTSIMNAQMWTPALDLTGLTDPQISYYTDYNDLVTESDVADLDFSVDGGSTWTNLISWNEDHRGPLQVVQSFAADGESNTVLRWNYTNATWDWWWQVDSVEVTACEPVSTFSCNAPAEGFENDVPPAGWSVQTNEPNGPQWTTIAACGETGNFTNGTGEAACVSSDVFGAAEMDTSLVTPMFSLAGFGAASLSYTANYQNFAAFDFLDVDISADGGATWATLLSWNEDHGAFRAQPGENVAIDLSAYAGQSGLMLRYRYYDPNTGDFNWYAQVDNVALTCGQAGQEPNIDVDPLSMSSTQATNTTTQQTLDVGNTGDADLTWTIAEEPTGVLAPVDDVLMKQLLATGAGNLRPANSGDAVSRGAPSSGPAPLAYTSPADFSEGFDDITTLPGWAFQNNSNPLGLTDWFQGNDTVFPAHAGAPTAYIGANFNNTSGVGDISNWMMTPEISLANGDTISFWTRTSDGSIWPDRVELRLSTAGSSTNVGATAASVGDFTTLLLSVNPTLVAGGYPETWTQYSATLAGIPGGATGRIAWRYYVTGGGPSGDNSNYIGIDTVEYVGGGEPQVCDAPSDVPWLSVSPANGTTAPAAITPVDVTFDSTGLAAGTYNANLCIDSNDPDPGPGNETELVIVPVELTVTAPQNAAIVITKTVGLAAGVCATTSTLDVAAGTTVYYCYTVTNTGDVTLNDHDLVDDQLGTIFSGLNYALTPGSSVNTVAAGLSIPAVINTTTTNVATWTAAQSSTGGLSATDTATATVNVASIEITKTVGTDPGVCAATSNITVLAGTTVYYCYTVTNTGDVTLNLHDLSDDMLGTLFSGLAYALLPGSSVNTVAAGLSIPYVANAPTTNTATWTAYNQGGPSVTDEASAFVDVIYFSCQNPEEDFESAPLGWTMVNNAGGASWGSIATCGESGSGGNFTGGLGDAACMSPGSLTPGAYDAEMRTPVFSLVGYSNSTISYLANYQNWAGIDRLNLDISADGGATWTTLRTWNSDYGAFQNTPGVYITVDLADYLGQSNLMLRWHYFWDNPQALGWYAQIDEAEFKCIEVPPTAVTLDGLSAAQTPLPVSGLPLAALPAVVSLALGAAYVLRRKA